MFYMALLSENKSTDRVTECQQRRRGGGGGQLSPPKF